MPVTEGIVVAEENGDLLRDAWRTEEAEKKKRADGKREQAALAMWRRFLMGLKILARLRKEYGDADDGGVDINPFTASKSNQISGNQPFRTNERMTNNETEEDAGFFREDESHEMGGGFIKDEKETIPYGCSFEIVLDDEDGSSTPRDVANIPAQNGTMSSRDVVTKKIGTKCGSRQWSTPSPEVRSAYFTKGIVENDGRRCGPSGFPLNTEGSNPCAKARIEVQIPITRVTPGRKRVREAPVPDLPDIETSSSSEVRRASKRRAVEAETGQSKYFTHGEETGKRRGTGKGR